MNDQLQNKCGKSVRYADLELNDNQQDSPREQNKHERVCANTGTCAQMWCIQHK